MSDLEETLLENNMIPLKITDGWRIIKNSFFKINIEWLNNLTEENKFLMSEIFLNGDIFEARYRMPPHSKISLQLIIYAEMIMKDKTCENINYSIEFNAIDEKKSDCLFSKTYNSLKVDEVSEKINHIMIKNYLFIDKATEKRDFSILLT